MNRVESRPGTGLVRALALSAAAAAVPIAGAFLFPEDLQNYEALTWLLLLVPAFLWAYERGWRGVATALASGMAVLSVTYAVSQSLGGQLPDMLLPVIVAYVAVSLGIGLFGEKVAEAQYAVAAETLALQDRLTGLANRRRVELHLDLQFATAERGHPLAVVLFDIDRLNAYNLRNGRSAGDGVLRGFASLLRQQTRRMDLAARYGPDEFLVVLGGATEEGAVVFAARVQEQLRAAEQTVALPTVSVGIACYRPDVGTPEDLIRAAEETLRLAKEDGRDRVRIHGRRLEELGEPDPQQVERAAGTRLASAAATRGFERDDDLALGAGRSTLVLTSDGIARARLAQILRKQGFEVTLASEPQDTIAALHQEFDILFIDAASEISSMSDLLGEIRYRWPATRVIGITPPDRAADASLIKIRVDGNYLVADDELVLMQQVRELLRERDDLAEAQLRHHQLSHELRSREREMRAALATSEARYNALVQASSEVVFTTDRDGRWSSVNPAWTTLTGFGIEETLGRPIFDFVHPEDAPALRAHFEQLLNGAPYWRHEIRWRTRDQSHRTVELRLEPARAADGAVEGTAGLIAHAGGQVDAGSISLQG
jgi:diguanylate cyclase (GGDEF)-like protein/PAS domain S-box-containing protein